jgi:hypothetical protein
MGTRKAGSTNNLSGEGGKEWAIEQEACLLYARSRLNESENSSAKEMAVACFYEYSREIALDETESTLFSRRPFCLIFEQSGLTWEAFRKTPWVKLEQSQKSKIIPFFGYSYGGNDPEPIWIPYLQLTYLGGVFKQFEKMAEEDLKKSLEAMQRGDLETLNAIAKKLSLLPHGESQEYVLINIDYREKKQAILKQFETWLDSREIMLKKHGAELKGSRFFYDSLRDLANWRLHRKLSMRGIDALKKRYKKPFSLNNESSYSEAKRRALKLRNFLTLLKFQNLRELEIEYQKPSDPAWERMFIGHTAQTNAPK